MVFWCSVHIYVYIDVKAKRHFQNLVVNTFFALVCLYNELVCEFPVFCLKHWYIVCIY